MLDTGSFYADAPVTTWDVSSSVYITFYNACKSPKSMLFSLLQNLEDRGSGRVSSSLQTE